MHICTYLLSCGILEANLIKCEKTCEICEGCGQKIHDRYLMRLADASWHEHCLACCVCGVLLNHSCYTRNTKLYCKADYDRYILPNRNTNRYQFNPVLPTGYSVLNVPDARTGSFLTSW